MNFVPSVHQAAGHDGCLTAGPVFAKRTTSQEIQFYADTFAHLSTETDSFLGSQIGHWMPTYMGTMSEGMQFVDGAMVLDPERVGVESRAVTNPPSTSDSKPFLVLSNLYYRFSHPCILDIKLGSILTDDTVTPEKKERLAAVSRSTTSGSLGFRICGMKIYGQQPFDAEPLFPGIKATMHSEPAPDGGFYTSFDKNYGRELNEKTVEKALAQFFSPLSSSSSSPNRKLLLTQFLHRLQLLYNCLLDTEVRIKSGSLLFLYEGNQSRWAHVTPDSYSNADPLVCDPLDATGSDSEDDEEEMPCEAPLSRLNLIDFAHAKYTPGAGPDDNILDGVENLVRLFEQLVASA